MEKPKIYQNIEMNEMVKEEERSDSLTISFISIF
jgi:hypothetical protein